MTPTPWLVIVLGLGVVGIGLLMLLGVPLGRLPGDIVVQRGRGTFYFPIVTCLVLSLLLTVLFALFRR
jgi:hypothetical protein